MTLRYINIWLSPETGLDDDYRYGFALHTRFICHFLSTRIRKSHFITDGSFDMISVAPKLEAIENISIIGINSLSVDIQFDKAMYDSIKNKSSFEYYLELLSRGFKTASLYKNIPLEVLSKLIVEFRNSGYKNEWLFKKKKFKEYDFEVFLNCYFSSYDFKLEISVKRISTSEILISGIIIRTLPHENYFDKMFKDIVIENGSLIVTYANNNPRVIIQVENILKRKFQFELIGSDEIKKILSYNGHNFE